MRLLTAIVTGLLVMAPMAANALVYQQPTLQGFLSDIERTEEMQVFKRCYGDRQLATEVWQTCILDQFDAREQIKEIYSGTGSTMWNKLIVMNCRPSFGSIMPVDFIETLSCIRAMEPDGRK